MGALLSYDGCCLTAVELACGREQVSRPRYKHDSRRNMK